MVCKTRSRNCLESPDGGRPCVLPGAENGSEGPPLGASHYRRTYIEGSTMTFQTVSPETVWKVLGERSGSLRSAPWRAGDTLRICPTTNGVASARICPDPQDKDALGFTAYGRSSTPSSTS